MLLFGIGVITVTAFHYVYWVNIEPTLRSLHCFDWPRFIGFWNAAFWDYKTYCVSEGQSLRWWWTYWASVWTVIAVQIGLACLGIPVSPKI